MTFMRLAIGRKAIVGLILANSYGVMATDAPPAFDAIVINGVPEVHIRYDDTMQVSLPADETLAKLISTRTEKNELQLSCAEQCDRLRDHPLMITLPTLNALRVQNGGRVQVLSSFPLTKTLNVSVGNGGDIDATKLPALATTVTLTNGGTVQLTACDRVQAYIGNGGNIVVDGNATLSVERRNGGDVRYRNKIAAACSFVTDQRDQRRYATVAVGTQEWFAENLAWLPRVCPLDDSECGVWVYGHDNRDQDAARRTEAYERGGALYSWNVATQACPQGWHLPTDNDWQQLEQHLGMASADLDQTIWRGPPLAPALKMGGESMLQVVLTGWRSGDGRFLFGGEHANFWTATPAHEQHAIERLIGRSKQQIGRHTGNMSCGFSVRCVRDKEQSKL